MPKDLAYEQPDHRPQFPAPVAPSGSPSLPRYRHHKRQPQHYSPVQVAAYRRIWGTVLLTVFDDAATGAGSQGQAINRLRCIAEARRELCSFSYDPHSRYRNDIGLLCDLAGVDRGQLASRIEHFEMRGWPKRFNGGIESTSERPSPLAPYVSNDGCAFYCERPNHDWTVRKFIAENPYPSGNEFLWR